MTLLHVIESDGGTIEFLNYFVLHGKFDKQILICGQRAHVEFNRYITEKYNGEIPSNIILYKWNKAQREIGIKDLGAFFELREIVNKSSFDFCILHSSKAGFLGRLLFYFKKNKNIIYVPNGLSFLRQDVSSFKIFLYEKLELFASMLAGNIICTSKSEMTALMRLGINCSYINNGTKVPSILERKNLSLNPIKIVSVGRLAYQKNPSLFNEIASQYVNNPNVQFVWIGDGELRSELTSTNIVLTGRLPQSDVLHLLEGCHIYLSTAIWEGLPFAVLEGMTKGLPLLLFHCVGNVDLVIENKNGFVFSTASEAIGFINKLLKENELRCSMGQESYNLVKKDFDAETMVNKYHEYIRESPFFKIK